MRRSVAPEAYGDTYLSVEELRIPRLGPTNHPSPAPFADLFVDEDDTVSAYADMQVLREISGRLASRPPWTRRGARSAAPTWPGARSTASAWSS